jgi:hypothetical protein
MMGKCMKESIAGPEGAGTAPLITNSDTVRRVIDTVLRLQALAWGSYLYVHLLRLPLDWICSSLV